MTKFYLSTLFTIILSSAMFAQGSIRGTILDDKSEALPGAYVFLNGTDFRGLTSIDGEYLPPHYLVSSSQGNFTYALFDTKKKTYITSFYIDKKDIDGVQETDGLEIMTTYMGSQFPEGILVVQDGFNFDGETKRSQNFKYIDISDVKAIIEKAVLR